MALLALFMMPHWVFLQEYRSGIEDYLVPATNTSIAKADTTQPTLSINLPPYKLDNATYVGPATATYSIDLESDTELISQNQDTQLQVASLTKLMTAYVALKGAQNLDRLVTIPTFRVGAGDATAGLVPGDTIAYRDLLTAMLINSGSDAAQSVALIDSDTQDSFVSKMNDASADLGLTNTHFSNPVGWDDANNYSSAKDIANLSRVLLRNDFFKATVGTKSKTISVSGREVSLRSTNNLLGVNGYTGVKTGYTSGAGECLASLEVINNHSILTVVLGSPNRFGETVAANTWTKSHFLW